jgi:hypothetical protein
MASRLSEEGHPDIPDVLVHPGEVGHEYQTRPSGLLNVVRVR